MKSRKIYAFLLCIALCSVCFPGLLSAQAPPPGEEALFSTSTSPDALIILDLSGSMVWNPAGDNEYYGASLSCTPNTTKCTGTGCSGGFCGSLKTNCNIDCSRIAIAKRAIFSILDDNNDNTITSSDEGSLGVRVGYMQYRNCSSGTEYSYAAGTACTANYTYCTGTGCSGGFCSTPKTNCNTDCSNVTGCIRVIKEIGTKYSSIYCANATSCTITSGSSCGALSCVNGATATGGTPLAGGLAEAKNYLDAHKAIDPAKDCRKKFVILLTDGSDTLGCGADGSECAANRYKNRRESVARAKALADAGYQLFVIGFGSTMPPYLQNTLNWMAYYGKTDDPNTPNWSYLGGTTAYNIPIGCDPNATSPVTAPCCNLSTNPTACYPAGVTQCATDSSTATAACYDSAAPYPGAGHSTSNYRANSNDPGFSGTDPTASLTYMRNLSGYAFIAADADQLNAALKTAINIVREATYSFTQASVQSSRTSDENYIYEASFEPVANDPFWRGHLKKYSINSDTGEVDTSTFTDAGDELRKIPASARNIYTCVGCTSTLTAFTIAQNIDPSYFGFTTTATSSRDAVIGYIRGNPAYNPDCTDVPVATTCTDSTVFKLGDVFRSSPITVGTPSAYFDDIRDTNHAFVSYRADNCRSSSCPSPGNVKRIIVVGANDGQLHAFKTNDMSEAWSFIAPNLLPKLKNITHTAHPTALTHQYFDDGPITVADVWLGPPTADGTSKSESEWRTMLIFGEGRGSSPNLWSSSSTCDSGFNPIYNASAIPPYEYYCGYYALDVTDTLTPTYKWHIGGNTGINSLHAPYLGDPWSKMMTGRVRINNQEKWVGLVGAGYNGSDCIVGTCDTRGKGFFIIDLSDGKILWSYTMTPGGTQANSNMRFSIPASAFIVDTDNDGFIDRVYIGDLGGNIWRFKFCTAAMSAATGGCNTSNWTGDRLFKIDDPAQSVYTVPAVARDGGGNLWVYWGTGSKVDPTSSTGGTLYALKDNGTSTNILRGDLEDISSPTKKYDNANSTKPGFYITLPGTGEKILADPTVFGGVVYFTTFVPATSTNSCDLGGSANIYAIWYTSGAGAFPGGRSMSIGAGIPSAPVISQKPGGGGSDIYVTTSGGGGKSGRTQKVEFNPPGGGTRTDILYWKDNRIQ